MLAPWMKSYDQRRQHIKKQRHFLADKCPYSQNYGFSSSHVWMWELDQKEGWALTNWCFWTVVLEKSFESPLDWKEIKPVIPKGNQSWIFTGGDSNSLATWCKELTHCKRVMLGKIESRRRGQQRTRWLHDIINSMAMRLSNLRR